MRRGLVIMVTLAAVALLSSGAGASTQTSRTVDVSTHAKAMQYLVSLGVDPSGVVIQRGAHNYAGPSCPGRGWTCTTAKRVLQIASGPPSSNTFVCADNSGTPPDCVIVQVASTGDNSATCSEASTAPDATQSCQIKQTNTSGTGANKVTITQSVNTGAGWAQTPTQYSGVLQDNQGGSNTVTIGQAITALVNQVNPSGSQSQDAQQGVYLEQTNSGSGANSATINQSENLKAAAQRKPSLTQEQNIDPADNTNALVDQSSGSGTNSATVNQSNVYVGNIQQAATGSQTQGSSGGGEVETFTQSSGSGLNTIGGKQTESQTQRADKIGTLTQNQYGPLWADPDQNGGGAGDTWNIDQGSTQNASNPNLQQDDEYAQCGTDGTTPGCTVNQSITQNGTTNGNSCMGSSCEISNGLTNGDPSQCNGEGCFPEGVPEVPFPPAFDD